MARATGVFAVLLTLAGLGWWLTSGTAIDPAVDPDRPGSVESSSTNSVEDGTSPSGVDRVRTRPVVEAPPVASAAPESAAQVLVAGRVFERVGGEVRPVPGARVVLGDPERHDARRLEPRATATAGADGEFRIVCEPGAVAQGAHLVADAPGYAADEWLRIAALGAEDEAVTDLELFVGPAARVEGRVVDEADLPVAGADVRASLAGSWERRRSAALAGSEYVPLSAARATSDDTGRFAFEGLTRGAVWEFVATESRRRGSAQLADLAPGHPPLVLRLEAPGGRNAAQMRVFGFVLGADGRPLPFAEVRLVHRGTTELETDERGAFEARIAPFSATVRLLALADGHAATFVELPSVETDVGPVLLRLQPDLPIQGVLVDADGAPIPAAMLRIEGDTEFVTGSVPPPTLLSVFRESHARTDADGAFTFDGLVAGRYSIRFDGGGTGHRSAVATVPAGTADLVLRAGAVIGPAVRWRVRVTDGITGAPIEGAVVSASRMLRSAYSTGSYGIASGTTGADGGAELAAGACRDRDEFQIGASADGYASERIAAAFFDVGEHAAPLALLPERSLRVEIRDANGRPVEMPQLEVRDGDRVLVVRLGQGGARSPVTADAGGVALLHGLPAKRLTVRAWSMPGRFGEQAVDLRAPREAPLQLVLPD